MFTEAGHYGDAIKNVFGKGKRYPIGYILENWRGDYSLLERNHFYIQWLFPNRMPGINSYACVLTDRDVEIINGSPELKERVKEAFEMMLDFYGVRLTRNNRFEPAENFSKRLAVLNQQYNHNYLRITRILLAIKELGHKDLMLPWLKFMADLVYRENLLNHAKESFENYWQHTLDEKDFLQLRNFVQECKSTKSTEEKAKATLHNTSTDTHEGTPSRTSPLTTPSNIHDNAKDYILCTPSRTSPLTTPSNTHDSSKDPILVNSHTLNISIFFNFNFIYNSFFLVSIYLSQCKNSQSQATRKT
ncbi:unnamed protein product [Acanthosepion pharaonis]|uniref:Opioid growth factor receptor (OGFr) conserved domain-containing protein n=1 Tax=Acanthosepion pharaonis TaxID=158019 RepID=A0A812CEA5_ACAPH|nr:unnamed protein product [Sepia pharaonis]